MEKFLILNDKRLSEKKVIGGLFSEKALAIFVLFFLRSDVENLKLYSTISVKHFELSKA